jgi:hypothetical protein
MDCSSQIVAGTTTPLLARVVKQDGTYIVQSDVSAIRVDVYIINDYDNCRTAVNASGATITDGSSFDSPSVSSVLYNSLQTNSVWNVDSVGYNLAYDFTPMAIDTHYEVRLTMTLSSGATVVAKWEIDSQ